MASGAGAPTAPTITRLLGFGAVTNGGMTADDVLTLDGTGTPDTVVTVFDGNNSLGTAAVNSSGAWSFTTGTLANGVQSFTATDTNAAGNTSAASPAFVVTVDTVMPPTPTITSWSPDSVNNVDYGVTNSSYLTLTGTAEANDTVNVFDNGTEIGTAAVNSSGAWTFSTGVIPNGINAFTVSDTDAAGSTSWPSYNPTYVVVDASTPLANPLVGGAQIGVMMDGAEASWVGYPSASDLDYLKSHGVDLVRLPIAWELMQNTLNGPLNATYLSGLENFLTEAAARGMQVIVDLQNYGGYDPNWQQWAATNNYGNFSSAIDLGQPIGSSAVPISSFVNFWTQLATALSGHAGLAGYDLMNEPQNLPNSTVWPTAAQEAVNAIRAVDMNSTIYVEGQEWSAASTWSLPWYSQTLNIVDPANKIVYEAHQYFDANSSGTYSQPFNSQTDYTNLGADLIQPFLSWLQANNDQGLIGEFGVPTTDPQWLPMLNAFMNSLQENNIPGIYTNYMYDSSTDPSWVPPSGGIAIDPDIGQGAAVMELIFEHTAPTIAGFVPTNGTGSSGTTTANILTLTGTGASYNTVNIYDNAALIGTTTSDITGAWSFTTGTLASGTNNFTATNIDAAGNSSEISYTLTVTVDKVAPPIIASDKIIGNRVILAGTAEAGTTIDIYDGTTLVGTTSSNAKGAWVFETPNEPNGAYTFTATATNAVGNISAASNVMDPIIGGAPAVSAAPIEVGNQFYIYNDNGSSVALMYAGADVVAGEFGGWVPIGAVQTTGGYDVAWEIPSANEYTIWTVDSNGNYLSSDGVLSGSSTTLESFAPVFGQDLNGGGVTGVPTVIQTDGSTSLTAVWYDYFLDNSGGSGPALKYGGADIVAGEFGGWVPIGAVQTASGYDVAWEIPGANEYSIWTVDSNGNYLSTDGVLSGSSTTLELFAPVFGQDLNGGGVTGVPTVIQADTGSFGSTSLTAVWFNYFLDNSSGSGPELKLNGADIVAGELGGWVPIGAVQTASGYDVAWEVPGANEYSIWTVDSNGNYLSSDGVLVGNSYALETLEATFGQDLNGDGVIGLYAAPGTTLQISEALAGPSGSATIGTAATLELAAADSASVTFSGSTGTLILGDPSTFSGEIFNFTGNGHLSGSDQIDLKGIKYNSVEDSYANGVLTVTDGTDTVRLDFNGSYTLANFDFASDGSGGTIVYDPPVPASNGSTPNFTASEPPIGATEGSTTIGTGATLELAAAVSGSVTFAGSTGTLSLDQPSTFTGTVSGFQGQDIIDLPGIAFGANTTLGYLPNSNQTGGTLTLTNATHSANIALLGSYMASSFAIVSDTSGGTMVVTEASQAGNQSLLTSPHA